MPDSAIGNASGWPEIDSSLLDTGRGTAGAPVDDVVQARPANRWRINPADFAAKRGAADLRKLRKPNNIIRSAGLVRWALQEMCRNFDASSLAGREVA